MAQLDNSDLHALTTALDALNALEVAIKLVSDYLSQLQRAVSRCELTISRDGT
jgi:hypothetical protein